MILTTEEIKDFFRNNREALKGLNCVFRHNGNQFPTYTLKEQGQKILDLAKFTDKFLIGQVWYKNDETPLEPKSFSKGIEKFIEAIRKNEITAISISPYKKTTLIDQINNCGSLD